MMTISRAELLKALEEAMPGVETGMALLEGADTFVFSDGFIHTYNDNISVSAPFAFPEEVSGAVKAQEFFNLIHKLSGESLKISCDEKSWTIKDGDAKITFSVLEQSSLKKVHEISPKAAEWSPLPENFMDCLKFCLFTINRSALSGVTAKEEVMMSTDERRVNWCKLSSPMEFFWISEKAAIELSKLKAPENYFLSSSWIHFLTKDNTMFSCKRLKTEKHPIEKIRGVIQNHAYKEGDVKGILPASVLDAVDRANTLAMNLEAFEAVQLTISPENIEVFSERSTGKYLEKIAWDKPFEKDFPTVTIIIPSNMIGDGMRKSSSFYLHEEKRGDRSAIRVIFENPVGIQLVNTFESKKDK